MRKIRSIDFTDVDTQMCLHEISEKLPALGISEEDVISIQRIWNDKPNKINWRSEGDMGNVTIFVFYWSDK